MLVHTSISPLTHSDSLTCGLVFHADQYSDDKYSYEDKEDHHGNSYHHPTDYSRWWVPSTRTLASMGSSGLAKLSCTPAQHIGMLVVLSSVEGAVVIGGTSGLLEWRENAGM